jgi:hypothetical protein
MLFGAVLFRCLVPLIRIIESLAGQSATTRLIRRFGLTGEAADATSAVFTSPSTTSAAITRSSFYPMDDTVRIDLPMYSLADVTEILAYGGFVGDASRGSHVLAYDDHDAERGPPFEP